MNSGNRDPTTGILLSVEKRTCRHDEWPALGTDPGHQRRAIEVNIGAALSKR
jgi:hypothetical protein